MDFETILTLVRTLAGSPGFDLIQTVKDVEAVKALKDVTPFDPVKEAAQLAAVIDANVRLAPLVKKMKDALGPAAFGALVAKVI